MVNGKKDNSFVNFLNSTVGENKFIRANPIVYFISAGLPKERAGFTKLMEKNGIKVKNICIKSGDANPIFSDIGAHLDLAAIDRCRSAISMFVYDYKSVEFNGHDAILQRPMHSAESVVRNIFIHRYKGIPFLDIGNDTDVLGKLWAIFPEVTLKETLNKTLNKALKSAQNNPAEKILLTEKNSENLAKLESRLDEMYYHKKFAQALTELNRGLVACPFPAQLSVNGELPTELKDLYQLAARKGIPGDVINRSIAQAFPSGEPVMIKSNLGGLSNALAFIAKPRGGKASVFIKIAPWLDALREFEGANFVINPRLKNFVAMTLATGNGFGPTIYKDTQKGLWGAVTSNLVGKPTDSDTIKPLKSWMSEVVNDFDPDRAQKLLAHFRKSLDEVVSQLHGCGKPRTIRKRPLWSWLGEILPPLASGELQVSDKNVEQIESYLARGFKPDAAYRLAEAEWKTLVRKNEKAETSPTKVCLKEFILDEYNQKDDRHHITVRHPDLGFRIQCYIDDNEQCWPPHQVKYGFPVTVYITLDKREVTRKKFWSALAQVIKPLQIDSQAESTKGNEPLQIDNQADSTKGNESLQIDRRAESTKGKEEQKYHRLWNAFGGDLNVDNLALSLTLPCQESAIHGDLNLSNLLFSSGSEIGWMIDFDRASETGMTAFDFAKLEVETWSHFLIPEILKICKQYPKLANGKNAISLLTVCLETLDQTDMSLSAKPEDKLVMKMAEHSIFQDQRHNAALNVMKFILEFMENSRRHALKTFGSCDTINGVPSQLALAISAYSFSAVKFAVKRNKTDVALALLQVSEHYFKLCWPGQELIIDDKRKELSRLCTAPEQDNHRLCIDSILLGISNDSTKLNLDSKTDQSPGGSNSKLKNTIELLQGNKPTNEVTWSQPAWDFASTGCVANISPIIGYLWLMTKQDIRVPKISSTGSGGGTVDTLSAGGYKFLSDWELITQRLKKEKGLFCKQDDTLVQVDRVTMARRGQLNLMKDPLLALSSILAKKANMSCPNIVIDVKIGCDNKFITSNHLNNHAVSGVDKRIESLNPAYSEACSTALVGIFSAVGLPMKLIGAGEQPCYKSTNDLKKDFGIDTLNIMISSSDIPQCQAIGRNLILLMLYRELSKETPFELWPEAYRSYYLELIPLSLELERNNKQTNYQGFIDEWFALLKQLPQLAHQKDGSFKLQPLFDELSEYLDNSVKSVKESRPLKHSVGIHAKTFFAPKTGRVSFIDAYYLDQWFDDLSSIRFDNEVGFWLHALPTGKNEDKMTGKDTLDYTKKGKPFITIFYRPNIMNETAVDMRMAEFFENHVVIKEQ